MRVVRVLRLVPLLALLSTLVACAGTPAVVRAEEAKTAAARPGAATIVMFTDFQCPFCRRTHALLAPLLAAHHARVRLVRVHVPLPRHPDARTAARAAVCVELLTSAVADDYADALYASPDLSEAACERLAVERGVDPDRFEACLAGPAVERRLAHDLQSYAEVDGDGVPLLFVGRRRIDGMPSADDLEDALRSALAARR